MDTDTASTLIRTIWKIGGKRSVSPTLHGWPNSSV